MNAEPRDAPVRGLSIGIVVCALAGLGVNLLMFAKHWADFGIAGCGGGSACDEILESRWSQIFGVPVTAIGAVVYLALIFALTRHGRMLLVPLLGCLAASVLWFVFVQSIFLGKFCPWCMAAHGIGLMTILIGWMLSRLQATSGFAMATTLAFFALSLSQLYGPLPTTHRIDELAESTKQGDPIHSRGEGRKVNFDGGKRTYNVSQLPHLGSDRATHVIVEYFDYQCAACLVMRGYLSSLVKKHPAEVCVVLLPVPLESQCNPFLRADQPQHPGSCERAKLALAVWQHQPASFAEFHEVAMSAESLGELRNLAEKILGSDRTKAAQREPWSLELISANLADWRALSTSSERLPKLLITGKRILQGLPPSEEEFIRVIEKELRLEKQF